MREGELIDGRYTVGHELGRGAMGVVYRARHVRVGCEVAIKIMHEHLSCDPDMIARFDREVALAGRLSHANVCGVIDTGDTSDGRRYMVMELADGETLTDVMARRLSHATVIDLLQQLLAGLAHAHARGLVHRDLKPDNILVDAAGRARIVDFGIAVPHGDARSSSAGPRSNAERCEDVIDKRLTDAGFVLGTPHYMAPEQAQGVGADPRSDLFALGVIAYEMLAGATPFFGSNVDVVLQTVTRDVPVMSRRAPGLVIDRELERFVYRLLERRPDDRFPSAELALDALMAMGQLDDEWDVATNAA
jgi:eukaryotic-like serine/threonine-protein kinase